MTLEFLGIVGIVTTLALFILLVGYSALNVIDRLNTIIDNQNGIATLIGEFMDVVKDLTIED